MSWWSRKAKEEGIKAAIRVAPAFLSGLFNIFRKLFRRESAKEEALDLVEDLAEAVVDTAETIVTDGVEREIEKLTEDKE